MLAFADELRNHGANATIRRTRGTEIDAACGQLRANRTITPVASPGRRQTDGTGSADGPQADLPLPD